MNTISGVGTRNHWFLKNQIVGKIRTSSGQMYRFMSMNLDSGSMINVHAEYWKPDSPTCLKADDESVQVAPKVGQG